MPQFENGQVVISPTLDSANYTVGDVLFTPIELEKAVVFGRGVIRIETVHAVWDVNPAPPMTLFFFSENPASFGALNDPVAVDFADMQNCRAITPLNGYIIFNDISVLAAEVKQYVQAADTSTSVWLAGQADGATTVDLSGKLTLRIQISEVS
jgi:hypothetical protein